MSDRVLSLREVAERLSISRTTLYEMRKAGLGPPTIKITTTRVGVRESDLTAFLDRLKQPGATALLGAGGR